MRTECPRVLTDGHLIGTPLPPLFSDKFGTRCARKITVQEIRLEPIKAMSKLVEACNECAELLLLGSVSTAEPTFQQLAHKLHKKFEQFRFELQIEIRRCFGADPAVPRSEPMTADSDILAIRAEISLQLALDHYQHALNTAVTAHARAMIKRQYSDIEQAYRELVSLHRAA